MDMAWRDGRPTRGAGPDAHTRGRRVTLTRGAGQLTHSLVRAPTAHRRRFAFGRDVVPGAVVMVMAMEVAAAIERVVTVVEYMAFRKITRKWSSLKKWSC